MEIPPTIIVIFGGAGDLTWRKLIPSLFDLKRDGRMPARHAIVAVDRMPMTNDALRRRLLDGVRKFARRETFRAADWNRFARGITYQQGDFNAPATYATLAKTCGLLEKAWRSGASRIFHLATPPRSVQHLSGLVTDWLMRLLLYRLTTREEYAASDISPAFWVNGRPPDNAAWAALASNGFESWRLEVNGLVEHRLLLSLPELRAMPRRRQITQHCCIQGWSAFAEWEGVPLSAILERCRPLPRARFLIFHTHQVDDQAREYCGSLDIREACYPQTILAYSMNGAPLPMNHGAPLRLRVETKLGFKMIKWLKSIELVEDYRGIGEGQGGYREDTQYYGTGAEI